jgi:hypothetical protein
LEKMALIPYILEKSILRESKGGFGSLYLLKIGLVGTKGGF